MPAIIKEVEDPHTSRVGRRHSLSSFVVVSAKVDPKMAQEFLRHSKVQTTLQLYTQANSEQTKAAQGAWLKALEPRHTHTRIELHPPPYVYMSQASAIR